MSTNSQDQEIDLGQIFKSIKGFFESISDRFFEFILFLKKNSIVIIILLILGFALGYFLDQKNKAYEHEIIVSPNFGSADYLYAKINLLNSKKREKDTIFLHSIGIKDVKHFSKIEIEPIVDVYKFIDNNSYEIFIPYQSVKNYSSTTKKLKKIFKDFFWTSNLFININV